MIREDDIQFTVNNGHPDYIFIESLYEHRNESRVSKECIEHTSKDYNLVDNMKFRMKMQLVESLYKDVMANNFRLKVELQRLIHPRHYDIEVVELLNRLAPTQRERFLV